ncbi:MAG TPA: riboflavin synthase [Gaiellaceae bacterium]|nr:riboflavin synthase [Gaiellaceae bacterium]
MFTGIVRALGRVESFEDGRLVVASPIEAERGDSVALDGVCLTVVEAGDGRLAFDVVSETRVRSKEFAGEVNIEPALRAGEPLGGHLVQGHVDGTGVVRAVEREGEGVRVMIAAPPELLRYCAEKGSIAVDGVSLTIAAVEEDAFAVVLVPHTLQATTLRSLGPGDRVNLEVDVVAKYVERLLEGRAE